MSEDLVLIVKFLRYSIEIAKLIKFIYKQYRQYKNRKR